MVKHTQIKSLNKLIKVLKVWTDGIAPFKAGYIRKHRTEAVQRILECSERTAWDYVEALERILGILSINNSTHTLDDTDVVKISRWLDLSEKAHFPHFYEYDREHMKNGKYPYADLNKRCIYNNSELLKEFHDYWNAWKEQNTDKEPKSYLKEEVEEE